MRKKLSAILLLGLFLFNLAGYKVLFYYLQQFSDQQMMASLNNATYNEAELIMISIPISLPYQNDWSDFERIDGEIDYEGIIYKFVKRKVINGELVLLCLPDNRRTAIDSAKDAFFKLASDLMHQNGGEKPVNHKVVDYHPLVEYQSQTIGYSLYATFKYVENHMQTLPSAKLASTPHIIPEHPPQT